MFEELLTVSSDEEEEDIKIVEEKLKDSKHISTPSKVKKMKQIVDVLSKQGHVPFEAAAKVRNIQFFSSQGPLSLEEGEVEMRTKKVKIKTTVVSHKRRKIVSVVQPRPQPGVGVRQRLHNSRLPVAVKQRRNIDQLRDQVGEEQNTSSSGVAVGEDSQGKKWAVRREISPHDREGTADLANSQDLSPSGSRAWELLAFDNSEEKEEVEESSSSSRSPSPVAANIATAEGSTRPRDYKELLAVNSSDEEERYLGDLRPEGASGLSLAPPASFDPLLELSFSSEEEEEQKRILPEDLIAFSALEEEEPERILSQDLHSCDISEETVVVTPSDALTPGRKVRSGEKLQSSQEAARLSITRPSQVEEEKEGEGGGELEVSEVIGVSQEEGANLSQVEFLRLFRLCSHREAEERR